MSISSDPDVGNSYVSQCNHEEADTRIFLHTKDIYMKGYETIVIRTVDPDVLGLSVSAFTHLADKIDELWIDFGTEKNKKLFEIHKIYVKIGADKAQIMLFFHAFTRCNQASFLSYIRKKSAWKVWDLFEEITPVFCR